MENILIIDDNESFCRTLSKKVGGLGMTAAYETSLKKGLERAVSGVFDVVFLDVNLPDGDGLKAIPQLRTTSCPPEIIIITGFGNESAAEIAIQNGAWDYIEKSYSFQNIRLSLTRALAYREQKKVKKRPVALKRDFIVGHSPAINFCLDQVAEASNSSSPVLITGSTGTGKELFAQAIHENSERYRRCFIVVDCTALPRALVESLLFGHRKGAFTGAHCDQEGLVQQADGGTLFLDEIGELPVEVQKRFLRVFQEKRFRPLGAKQEVSSDFRLICATHRDLSEMVVQGRFREDLFYRIRAIQISLPELRQRREDIPSLVLHHIRCRHASVRGHTHGLSPDFLEALLCYEWPGNVRELFNTIDRAVAVAYKEAVLFPSHLPENIRTHVVKQKLRTQKEQPCGAAAKPPPDADVLPRLPFKAHVEAIKQRYIEDLMHDTRGDIHAACRISGLSRAYIYQLLKKYRLHF